MFVRGCTEKTISAYKQEYRFFLSVVNKSIGEIYTGDIKGYLSYCKLVRNNSDITINNHIRMLRGLFTWLYEEGYISDNPMIRIRENKVEHRVKEVFSEGQLRIIKRAAKMRVIRYIALVEFLHSTGARISEVVALNKEDIDLQECQCIVYGKGRKERVVYFNKITREYLKEYFDSRNDDNPALFVSGKKPNKRLSDGGCRAMLNSLCIADKRLEGLAINPHKWRRQFVTELLEKDAPITLVADLAGHTNINTTKESYSNYSQRKIKEAYCRYMNC